MKKIRYRPLLLAALVILSAAPLFAHDFWLVPNALRVAPGEVVRVEGRTSSDFPTSLSAVTVDRIATARWIGADAEMDIGELDVSGSVLRLSHRPATAGQGLVAVTIHPRYIPESPESFRRYLTLEGAPEALERYERQGILPTDSITRGYAKYAKTLVEVGTRGPRAFARLAGHPLEFVPLSDPAGVEPGSGLRFRMLFLGEPLAHARGHASVAESADSETAYDHVEFETDSAGEFEITVAGAGLWNVRALHIVPAPEGSESDWDVHWATFVWGLDG